jgi:hypothetical protein
MEETNDATHASWRIEAALNVATQALGIEPITLEKVERFRWYLVDRKGIGPELIRLERFLQNFTGRPIDLRIAPKKDQNKRFDRNYLRKVEAL